MNSSLDALVKNLTDNDFKYLSQEFSGDLLELVKQKGVYPYECMDSFEKFSEDNYLIRINFLVVLKMNALVKKIIYMLLMFVMCLKWIQWVTVMIFI